MAKLITVACVLRTGGCYTPEWVLKLKRGVAEHLLYPHRFVCITDTEIDGVFCLPISEPEKFPKWWAKIQLFRAGLFHGPVVYLDLDVLVTGDLDPLVKTHNFWMAEDFIKGPGFNNSSYMSFTGDWSFIFGDYLADPTGNQRRYDKGYPGGRIGDQAFIEDAVRARQVNILNPRKGLVVSYKKDARDGPPPGAAVVAFHGRPKPDKAKGWSSEQWSEL